MPETVQPRRRSDGIRTGSERRKTPDGRILRQSNEDPELRADDSVLIEMVPLDDMCTGVPCNYQTNSNNNNNGYNENGDRNASNCNNDNSDNNNAIGGNNSAGGLTNTGVDLSALASGNANGSPTLTGNNNQRNNRPITRSRANSSTARPRPRTKGTSWRNFESGY